VESFFFQTWDMNSVPSILIGVTSSDSHSQQHIRTMGAVPVQSMIWGSMGDVTEIGTQAVVDIDPFTLTLNAEQAHQHSLTARRLGFGIDYAHGATVVGAGFDHVKKADAVTKKYLARVLHDLTPMTL
ncbi:MAG: hypothetical protein ACOCWQ_04045, partial [Nanoarchaeota archaeon]